MFQNKPVKRSLKDFTLLKNILQLHRKPGIIN